MVPKGFGIELFVLLQGGVDAAFESSIEGVDVVRSNENDAFVVFDIFQRTRRTMDRSSAAPDSAVRALPPSGVSESRMIVPRGRAGSRVGDEIDVGR